LASPNPKDRIRETVVSNSIRKAVQARLETVCEGLDYSSKQSIMRLEIPTNAKEHSTGGSSSTKIYNKGDSKALKQGSNYSETNQHFNDSPNENRSVLGLRGLDSHRDSEANDRPQSERLQYHCRKDDPQTDTERRTEPSGETLQSESATKGQKNIYREELLSKLNLKKAVDLALAGKGKVHRRGNFHDL
jgi:hypothetical protein